MKTINVLFNYSAKQQNLCYNCQIYMQHILHRQLSKHHFWVRSSTLFRQLSSFLYRLQKQHAVLTLEPYRHVLLGGYDRQHLA
jgi:hypothetical protein